eukprot:7722310-Pyramimonas_sp.AAC.1
MHQSQKGRENIPVSGTNRGRERGEEYTRSGHQSRKGRNIPVASTNRGRGEEYTRSRHQSRKGKENIPSAGSEVESKVLPTRAQLHPRGGPWGRNFRAVEIVRVKVVEWLYNRAEPYSLLLRGICKYLAGELNSP